MSVNEQQAKELIKNLKEERCIRNLKTMFGQWSHCLQKIKMLSIYYVSWMCSTHNEGKSVIAERFLKTLKAKI